MMTSDQKRQVRMKANPTLWFGGTIVALLLLASLIGPLFSSTGPLATSTNILADPSWSHPFGTDSIGRDIMARVLIGLRASFIIVGVSALLSITTGAMAGLLAAYFGGAIDWFLMRVIDMLLAVPTLLLAVAVLAALGPSSAALILVLGVTYIPHASRVVRVSAMQVTSQEFTVSARISGVPWYRILFRHIMPNIRGILFVQTAVTMANMLVVESSLSFLGLGVPPPTPSIGFIIAEGRQWMEIAPWPVLAASSLIVLLILGITLTGQGLDQMLSRGRTGRGRQ